MADGQTIGKLRLLLPPKTHDIARIDTLGVVE